MLAWSAPCVAVLPEPIAARIEKPAKTSGCLERPQFLWMGIRTWFPEYRYRHLRHNKCMRFLHTMLRVGNLQRSIDFYTKVLGMQLLRTSENPEYKYSLAFLGFDGGNPGQAEIELTYNWGTDSYELGTAYGHIALGVPDAYAACEKIKAAGGNVTREAGPVKGGSTVIAFVTDPDGYKIELIQENSRSHGSDPLRNA